MHQFQRPSRARAILKLDRTASTSCFARDIGQEFAKRERERESRRRARDRRERTAEILFFGEWTALRHFAARSVYTPRRRPADCDFSFFFFFLPSLSPFFSHPLFRELIDGSLVFRGRPVEDVPRGFLLRKCNTGVASYELVNRELQLFRTRWLLNLSLLLLSDVGIVFKPQAKTRPPRRAVEELCNNEATFFNDSSGSASANTRQNYQVLGKIYHFIIVWCVL